MHAASKGNVKALRLLIQVQILHVKYKYTQTNKISQHTYFDFLKAHANIHLTSDNGSTAFTRATRRGNKDIVQLLIDQGCSPAETAKTIWDAADKNDIAALTLLCVQWAGNTQAIDGHEDKASRAIQN